MTIGLDGTDYMTYEEFGVELEKLGLQIRGEYISNASGNTVASFDKNEVYVLDTDYFMFMGLEETTKVKLHYLLTWLASTPIDKRVA